MKHEREREREREREPQKERINSIRIPSPPPCLSAPSGRALMSSSESILPQSSLLRSLSEPQTPECHIVWASARPPWDLPPRRAERAPRGPKTAHESPETPGERSTAPAESKPTPPRTSKGRRRRKTSERQCLAASPNERSWRPPTYVVGAHGGRRGWRTEARRMR